MTEIPKRLELIQMEENINADDTTANIDPLDQKERTKIPTDDSRFQTALLYQVISAKETSELLRILEFIKISDLQSFLYDKINEMDIKRARNLHHQVVPMSDVLSDDVIQRILSFGHCNQNRTVCQRWNRLNEQNEENTFRAIYEAVDDLNLDPVAPGILTWIVHPTRREWVLYPFEARRGFQGPVRGIVDVPQHVSSRVLVHPGSYRYEKWFDNHIAGINRPNSKRDTVRIEYIRLDSCF